MLWSHSYRGLSLVCYILRLLVILALLLQIFFYAKLPDDTLLGIVNDIYPYIWAAMVVYCGASIWVHMSVLYWSRVMVTK